MAAPIVVFAYNRREHLKATLEALCSNEGVEQADAFIFVDKAKQGEEDTKNQEVVEYLEEFRKTAPFAKLTITYAAEHKGLANSVIAGVTQVIDAYGRVIVLEDDIVTAPAFLAYMNKALEVYEKEQTIWSVSGYTLPLPALEQYPQDVYKFYRCCSWGWATWKDRWDRNDWSVGDYSVFRKSLRRRYRFNKGGNDLAFMLDRQMLGRIDSWATRWGYMESRLGMFTIYPAKSLVENKGCDGSGTHFASTSSRYDTIAQTEKKDYQLVMPELNREVCRQFHDRYSEPKLKHLVKEMLYCMGLYQVK